MTRVASEQMSQAELARELDELRARQEAVAGVLLAMTQSGLRLQPILDEIVANAARLCLADQAFIWLSEGEVFRARGRTSGRRPRSWSSSRHILIDRGWRALSVA